VVQQSTKGAGSAEELSDKIMRRLVAMSTAQDILASENGDQGAMAKLIEEILSPFASPRLVVKQGPDLKLAHGGVVALALALNELATNATKFGALLTDAGRVSVNWRKDGAVVCLVWREIGGPAVTAPSHIGFGSRLIRDAARRLPQGEVELDFRQTGLVAQIRFVVED
jgi:two-component sensor histidine kinase